MNKVRTLMIAMVFIATGCAQTDNDTESDQLTSSDAQSAATNNSSSETDQADSTSLSAFYKALHGDASSWQYESGEWKEDFGDGAAFGAFYFANRWDSDGNEADRKIAEETFTYNLSVVTQGAGDVAWALDNLEEVFMAVQGVIEGASALGYEDQLEPLDTFIDTVMDPVVAGLGDYADLDAGDFAADLYGPTSLTAGVAVIYSQYALRLNTAQTPERLNRAMEILDAIHEKAWDEEGNRYLFRPDEEKLFLYPNGTMLIALNRVFALSGEPRFLERAQLVYTGIQPLRKEMAYYQSPYSQEYQGAKTDEYGTLSAQNYLMIGLLLLHENTGEDKYLLEVLEMLHFIREKLYIPGENKIVHHWIDGRPALETDPDYFCSGCNLQVLYILWYIENTIGAPLDP